MADNPDENVEEPEKVEDAGKEDQQGEKKDDFRYIVRIASTDLDGNRKIQYALTGIMGIGDRTAKVICNRAGVDPVAVLGYMKPEEVEKVAKVVDSMVDNLPAWMVNRRNDYYTAENRHLLGTDLLISYREDINLMRKIRCYRGIRHERGHKVRGQRTKSTGRTGAIVGVSRKGIIASAAAAKKKE
jgi:small subunit ribosomal protein S13